MNMPSETSKLFFLNYKIVVCLTLQACGPWLMESRMYFSTVKTDLNCQQIKPSTAITVSIMLVMTSVACLNLKKSPVEY